MSISTTLCPVLLASVVRGIDGCIFHACERSTGDVALMRCLLQALYDFVDLEINRDRLAADGYDLECTYPRAMLPDEIVALDSCLMTRGRYMLALIDKECDSPSLQE